ncbi:MAG TPA: sigma-70 family RNA polymerase sigma factor [Pseudacidobacterium sp.]|jgi:RNA polymerase sigma-70 factor (ECF subfamily)|nr:sigma-70 family RNA polymerase sigma factor [Pseudacidobacterium sp.]
MDREAAFLELKPMLFSLAYRMLGARADAEDVVQETWLRWREAAEDEIRSPRAYLTTVTARLSLDALKSARRKREVYVGPWLPEPLVEPSGAHSLEVAESLSVAFLHLLESLSPPERIAFLLYEIFEMPYPELASVLETTDANCRQLVTRARKHIQQKKRRFSVDREHHRNVLEKFLYACASGNTAQLTSLLHQDVVLYSDGGGKVRAALNPIFGIDKVIRFFAGVMKKNALHEYSAKPAEVNGEPGAVLYTDGDLTHVLSLELDESGRIVNIFLIANPEKLPENVAP